jgi:hypothetical protein
MQESDMAHTGQHPIDTLYLPAPPTAKAVVLEISRQTLRQLMAVSQDSLSGIVDQLAQNGERIKVRNALMVDGDRTLVIETVLRLLGGRDEPVDET